MGRCFGLPGFRQDVDQRAQGIIDGFGGAKDFGNVWIEQDHGSRMVSAIRKAIGPPSAIIEVVFGEEIIRGIFTRFR